MPKRHWGAPASSFTRTRGQFGPRLTESSWLARDPVGAVSRGTHGMSSGQACCQESAHRPGAALRLHEDLPSNLPSDDSVHSPCEPALSPQLVEAAVLPASARLGDRVRRPSAVVGPMTGRRTSRADLKAPGAWSVQSLERVGLKARSSGLRNDACHRQSWAHVDLVELGEVEGTLPAAS